MNNNINWIRSVIYFQNKIVHKDKSKNTLGQNKMFNNTKIYNIHRNLNTKTIGKPKKKKKIIVNLF